MGTYLMGASCFQPAFHQCYGPKALQDVIVRDGRLAYLAVRGIDGHLQAVLGMPADVALDGAVILLERSPHQRIVLAAGSVVEELLAQMRLRLGSLGYHQQAAGILVYAVHQPYGRVIRVKVMIVPHVPGQRIHQCAAIVAAARMNHHAGRLVDHQQLVVLIYHIQRYLLRDNLPVAFGTVQYQRDDIIGLDLVVALDGLVVYTDAAGLCSLLDAVSTGIAHMIHQELVNAHSVLTLVHLYAPMLMFLRG